LFRARIRPTIRCIRAAGRPSAGHVPQKGRFRIRSIANPRAASSMNTLRIFAVLGLDLPSEPNSFRAEVQKYFRQPVRPATVRFARPVGRDPAQRSGNVGHGRGQSRSNNGELVPLPTRFLPLAGRNPTITLCKRSRLQVSHHISKPVPCPPGRFVRKNAPKTPSPSVSGADAGPGSPDPRVITNFRRWPTPHLNETRTSGPKSRA